LSKLTNNKHKESNAYFYRKSYNTDKGSLLVDKGRELTVSKAHTP